MPYFELSKDEINFPPGYYADIDGLLAIGGDLSAERLLLAYNSGIYYWHYPLKHIKWWSPDPRIVLKVKEFNLSGSRLEYLQNKFTICLNTDFEKVLRSCQQVYNIKERMNNEWLTERAVRSFLELHKRGYANAIEVWEGDHMVGGLFGVAIGKMFFGEYIFSTVKEADEAAILFLIRKLKEKGFQLIDIQKETMFFEGIEYDEVSRIEYVNICKENAEKSTNLKVDL